MAFVDGSRPEARRRSKTTGHAVQPAQGRRVVLAKIEQADRDLSGHGSPKVSSAVTRVRLHRSALQAKSGIRQACEPIPAFARNGQ
jgi:hypothetical protein